MDLKSTLNLPDAEWSIPMRAGLTSLEPKIQAQWDELNLYQAIQERLKDAPTFVFHDGPPYTNSPIHMGTAMNKVLKDMICRSQTLMGRRAPFVPGYDNHGLPIEQAVMKKFQEKKQSPTLSELRQACRDHAAHYIGVQTEQFRRLGVQAMWDRPYTTMDYRFEAEILRTFKRLVERGYIYRGLRPVLWSPTSRTALADTEIVYEDHVSRSIYVGFPLKEDRNNVFAGLDAVEAVMWTTTPWTVPANVALAFHPQLEYAVVRFGAKHYVVAEALREKVSAHLGWQEATVVKQIPGQDLEGVLFAHPIYKRDSVGVLADYVTTEDGTGIVHTAPGHGRDDFYTGRKYGLPILCPVDDRGVLTAEAGEFEGVFYKDCDKVVVERLAEEGHLLKQEEYRHSYPHAERDGQPVIFRATDQWFVNIDHNDLRQRMLAAIDEVQWLPASGYTRIRAMIENRPDWCISRQRPWGVGIPAFFGKESGKPVLDPVAIEAVAKLVEERGSDAWYEVEPSEILPAGYTHPETGETEFVKETDVFDVWFDSGSTSLCVLEGNVEPRWQEPWPADLYFEGSDQHRGWFNVSLILGMATRDAAPYRTVVTHGFVVDDQGRKMSKRLGNVIDPMKAAEQHGAEVLRTWVASVKYEDDVPCTDALLKVAGDTYRRIRNTLRFLHANLYDYRENYEITEPLDQWVISETDRLVARVLGAYEKFDFMTAQREIHNFCGEELSAFYLDTIKDRMYCDGQAWESRRSGQAACAYVLDKLTLLLAPILPHTAEEVYDRLPGEKQEASVHFSTLTARPAGELADWEASELRQRVSQLLQAREVAFAAFETFKGTDGVKDSQDASLTLTAPAEAVASLESWGEELALMFKVSEVKLQFGEWTATFEKSPYLKCERSRLRRPDVAEVDGVALSARDRRAIQEELTASS